MLKVGITGGIGSGKSVVCRVFATLGIPVLNADETAKYLMENDAALRQSIRALLGNDAYIGNKPDKVKIASIVFGDPAKLQQLNALVHPATVQYARDWIGLQQGPYIIKEAAIFFESGTYTDMDIMVGVSAPVELRIARAMSRSDISRQKVLEIMSRQMDEEEKMSRCDHVIFNDDQHALLPQVIALHSLFANR